MSSLSGLRRDADWQSASSPALETMPCTPPYDWLALASSASQRCSQRICRPTTLGVDRQPPPAANHAPFHLRGCPQIRSRLDVGIHRAGTGAAIRLRRALICAWCCSQPRDVCGIAAKASHRGSTQWTQTMIVTVRSLYCERPQPNAPEDHAALRRSGPREAPIAPIRASSIAPTLVNRIAPICLRSIARSVSPIAPTRVSWLAPTSEAGSHRPASGRSHRPRQRDRTDKPALGQRAV